MLRLVFFSLLRHIVFMSVSVSVSLILLWKKVLLVSDFTDVIISKFIREISFSAVLLTTKMYCNYSRILKIPIELAALRKLTPITTKCLSSTKGTLHKNYYTESTNEKENWPLSRYKYLCYSILWGATAYASYKIW